MFACHSQDRHCCRLDIQLCSCRPTILRDEEFSQVQKNLEALQHALPGADVLGLVEQQVAK